MSVLLENKTLLIHVACEVVVLGVLIFWVHRKTSNLWDQIDELSQRLEDQEDKIQNHERIIKEMIQVLKQRQPTSVQSQPPRSSRVSKKPHLKSPVKKPTITKSRHNNVLVDDPVDDPVDDKFDDPVDDEFDETESEMDEALKDELAELDIDFSEETGDEDPIEKN